MAAMQIRIAQLDTPENALTSAGLFACRPQGKDQSVQSDFLSIEELSSDPKVAHL
ncbi:DUF1349 domain-containing protein [Bacillales bacterium AN1005]|uniref:DUF1349 domain-containing protein n=1 Tax=Niallia taxi TaxID=2499688 RepID=UPI0021A75F6D|nr:DUF1349 domain-containing protein [Niallia taxi]MCT2345702.1 DUF1349 domain-containing protein [Niallia taxi]